MHLNELPPGRLLEIGCGDGEFLAEMKSLGWSVDGMDFDAKAACAAKEKFGIDVKVGNLANIGYPESSFDAVTMKHVIEHIFDPISTLREVCRILKPGGTLTVVTPNACSLGSLTYGRNWRGLEPPRHIHVFTPGALDASAKTAGLETVRVYSTAANAWGVLSASMVLAEGRPVTLSRPKPTIISIFRGLAMHFREARLNKVSQSVGEECVLLARKYPS